uniref:Uncharacterized protein n=1 Tax=Anguilla anguilla TaxID=7936 RepID=A0A0E9S853_ANGAN
MRQNLFCNENIIPVTGTSTKRLRVHAVAMAQSQVHDCKAVGNMRF